MIVQDATESGDAKYRCAECNLQFGTPRDLSRHLNKTARHGGQPSPCAICHKPLTRPDSRARHERRCRERFGVTEEMWQGIERERQRGRRKSISVDGPEEPNTQLAGDGGCDATTATASTGREHCGGGGGSSRSRTVSVSEVSDAELVAALASTKVASSAPGPNSMPGSRYMPNQPSGEASASWTRRRSASLRAPHPHPHPQPTPLSSAKDGAVPMNGRKRRESSPHARGVLPPPPPPQSRVAPTTSPQWRTVSRLPHQHPHHLHHHHEARDDSPPFEPPSSPMAIQDESDGEPMVSTSAYRSPQHQHHHIQQHQQPRWTPLVKREERLVEFAQEGEEDEEDELEDEDEPWHPSSVSRVHNNQQGMMTGPPPPKKKLFGFEQDGTGTGGGIASWSPSHKTQR